MKVGVIGLGSMGMGAALNLVKSGHDVHGCEPREAVRAELALRSETSYRVVKRYDALLR